MTLNKLKTNRREQLKLNCSLFALPEITEQQQQPHKVVYMFIVGWLKKQPKIKLTPQTQPQKCVLFHKNSQMKGKCQEKSK